LEVEFIVFLFLVSEVTFSSSHSAPLVTNLNDFSLTNNFRQSSTKLYLNRLLVAVCVCCKGMSYSSVLWVPRDQWCSNSVPLLGTGL